MSVKDVARLASVNSFEKKVFSHLEALLSQKRETKIAIGVSGGADSLALVLLTHAYLKAKSGGGTLTALTVDHGLRLDSAQEARFVAKLLSSFGIQHKILTWGGEKPKSAFQEKARFARHRLLREYCRQEELDALFLAHHYDDQEETLLMRYLRQSRLGGLSGMSAVSTSYDWPGGKVIRPLLSFPKKQLIDYLNEKKIEWLEDPSNKNLIFERVRLRQVLASYRPWILDYLQTFGRLRASYEKVMGRLSDECVTLHSEGYATLEGGIWNRIPATFQYDLFERIIMAVGGHSYPPRRKNLDLFCDRLKFQKQGRLSFGGCLINITKTGYRIIREPSAVSPPCQVQEFIEKGDSFLWDRRYRWVRNDIEQPQAQLLKDVTIGALGHQGVLHLREEKKLGQHKDLPSSLLQTFPTFRRGDETLCIPFLGYTSNPKWAFLLKSLIFDPMQPLKRIFVTL